MASILGQVVGPEALLEVSLTLGQGLPAISGLDHLIDPGWGESLSNQSDGRDPEYPHPPILPSPSPPGQAVLPRSGPGRKVVP